MSCSHCGLLTRRPSYIPFVVIEYRESFALSVLDCGGPPVTDILHATSPARCCHIFALEAYHSQNSLVLARRVMEKVKTMTVQPRNGGRRTLCFAVFRGAARASSEKASSVCRPDKRNALVLLLKAARATQQPQ